MPPHPKAARGLEQRRLLAAFRAPERRGDQKIFPLRIIRERRARESRIRYLLLGGHASAERNLTAKLRRVPSHGRAEKKPAFGRPLHQRPFRREVRFHV